MRINMKFIAALIQFPEINPLALAGVCVIALSLLFGVLSNHYLKRSQHNKEKTKLHWEGVHDIFDDKKLSQSEIELLEKIITHHNIPNPLHAVSTRDGFGKCVEAEMNEILNGNNGADFQTMGLELRDIRVALGLDYIPIGKPIFSSREIHVGQHLAIAVQSESKPQWCDMVVQEVDEAYLYISPTNEALDPHFSDGTAVRCTLWREEDGRYTFESRIVFHGDVHAKWRLSHNVDPLKRSQDRGHFRMRFEQTVTVGILNASISEEIKFLKDRKSITKLRGKITSLSAGGCAIVFQQAIAKNVLLKMDIELPGEVPLTLIAKIVNASSISGGRNLIRTQFISASEEERDIITRHLLHKQQETIS